MTIKAKRFSSEYTMLSILEYLCVYSTKTPISKYHIMTKIAAIRQQRPDRISLILNRLEDNGYIKSIVDISSTTNLTTKLYLVTEKGFDAYLKWVKEFLSFVRSMNNDDDIVRNNM
ncbi:MAG TPA: PadR family transcriptional regulator [Nitrososphaeraceae archaeon]|nr:PadR family transcriptional regulator [Nitrososphaeraceae archaeon]HJT84672.1 PadR family transcriptional regulator [Nitrososphaeraceae archaeon]